MPQSAALRPPETRPRLSVIVASYNGAKYIREQLDSVLPQLQPQDEVVLSDDASTDATVDIVRSYEDPRIRVLAQTERLGYVRNFERAAREAHGDVIFFCDQDDVWLPGKVQSLLTALERCRCAASDAVVVDDALRVINPSYFELRRARAFSPLAILLRPPIIGATLACRRDFLRAMLPFPAKVPHDFWLTFNAALKGQLVVLREPTIMYRRHGGVASLSTGTRRRAFSAIVGERLALLLAFLRTKTWRKR